MPQSNASKQSDAIKIKTRLVNLWEIDLFSIILRVLLQKLVKIRSKNSKSSELTVNRANIFVNWMSNFDSRGIPYLIMVHSIKEPIFLIRVQYGRWGVGNVWLRGSLTRGEKTLARFKPDLGLCWDTFEDQLSWKQWNNLDSRLFVKISSNSSR